MRFLILSDIHANWEALQAVLAHAEGRYDQILCLGDLVGYGADPNAVVEWARRSVAAVVRGNHDKVCAGLSDMDWFGPRARAAAAWTREELSPANLEYLRHLPQGPLAVGGFQILHGSPADEDEYLIETADVLLVKPYLTHPVSFFGHTHLQGGFLACRAGFDEIPATPHGRQEHVVEIPEHCFCLANPGSVGQPRDGDPRAAYLLYGPGEKALEYRRVAYDVAAAQQKIRRAGLPAALADRLAAGL
jgi:predicted phosphodiesterase